MCLIRYFDVPDIATSLVLVYNGTIYTEIRTVSTYRNTHKSSSLVHLANNELQQKNYKEILK